MGHLFAVTSGLRFTILLVTIGLLGVTPLWAQTTTLTKQFLSQPLPGETVQIQYVLTNTTGSFLQTASFSDDLDAALTGMTSLGAATNDCGGTVSGTSIMNFSRSFMPPSSSCTLTVLAQIPVTATPGTYPSTTSTVDGSIFLGAAYSDPGATDNLVVLTVLVFAKSFINDPVNPGDSVTLEFTLTNGSALNTLTDITFTDDLDAALSGLVATGLPLSGLCGLGTISGTSTLSFSGGRLSPSQGCSFQVTLNVPGGATTGSHTNTTSTISTMVGMDVINSPAASDDLKVGLPVLTKDFSDDPVFPGETVTLDFTITNGTSADTFTDINFVDDLDAALSGLDVNSLPVDGFCGAGSTMTGTTSLTMSGGILAPLASCSFSVILNVPNDAPVGTHLNTTGSLFATTGMAVLEGERASDSLQVAGVPILTKTFTNDPVAPGEQVTLEFTINNLNRDDGATNISFTDDLDAALFGLLATGLPLVDPCGAGSSLSGTGNLTFSGGTLGAQGSCTFSVTLDVPAASVPGTYPNVTSALTSTVGGTPVIGATAADSLVVEPATLITLDWSDDPVASGSSATLDITLTNSSIIDAASAISFTLSFDESLPTLNAGPITTCDGDVVFAQRIISPPPGDTVLAHLDYGFVMPGTLSAGASCTIQLVLDVAPEMAAGIYPHTSSGVTSTVDAITYTGPTATDNLVVAAGPILGMVFTDDPTLPGGTVNLELTLTHDANATTDATGIGFTIDLDAIDLDAGADLVNLAATGLPMNDDCGMGSSISGTGLLTFSGGTLAPGDSCTFNVPIVVPVGALPNDYTVTSSAVTSTVSGLMVTGSQGSDDLTVGGFILSKQFLTNPVIPGETVVLEYTFTNFSLTETATLLIPFNDDLNTALTGLAAIALPANDICGTPSTVTGAGVLSFSGMVIAPNSSCSLQVTCQVPLGAAPGTYTSTSASQLIFLGPNLVTGAPASDSLTVFEPLSITKTFTNDPANPGGTVDLEFTLANTDLARPITAISFTDDLDAALSNLVAAGLPANDICGMGSSISGTNLLTFTGGSLAANASCTFSMTLQIDGATMLGATGLNTTSSVTGTLAGITVTGGPATDTLVISNDPPPGFSKNFSPGTIGALESSTLTFTIDNSIPATGSANLSFTDNLPPGVVVAAIPNAMTDCSGGTLTADPGMAVISYSGGSAPAGGMCTISVDVTSAIADTYVNLTGDLTSDFGNSGTATDTLIVTESPAIGVAKQAGMTVDNGDGTFTAAITLTVENLGNVPLNNVQVTDSLTGVFAAPAAFVISTPVFSATLTANAGYNGAGDSNLLAGADSLAVTATATITFGITFTPNTATGPFSNQAAASAISPDATMVNDNSHDGLDPDPNGNGDATDENDPTSISFTEIPFLGVAKQAGMTTDNGNGTFSTTVSMVLENLGNVPLANVQVTDNLATTFAAPATFNAPTGLMSSLTINAGFNGNGNNNLLAGSDSLAVGAAATISFNVTFTPNTATGPFLNQSVATASSPAGAMLSDNSHDGVDPDPNGNGDPTDENDPTPISFIELPSLGVAKQVGTVTDNGDGTFSVTVSMVLENFGNVPMANVQVTDDLNTTFAAPVTFSAPTGLTSSLTANGAFNGSGDTNLLAGSDSLDVATTATLSFNVTFTPNAATGPFLNQSVATATSPAAAPVTDNSHDGADPDPNGDGDPTESDPTSIAFTEIPVIGVAKQAGAVTDNGDGTFSSTISLVLENFGNVPLLNVQLSDDLTTTFAAPTTFSVSGLVSSLTANGGFNGDGDANLLAGTDTLNVGAVATASFIATFTPNTATGPFFNQAVGSATSPAATPVTDNSHDGTDPDPNANGDPTDENDPTSIAFTEIPVVGIAKQASTLIDNGDGTFTTTISMVLENFGNVPLLNVQVTDDLDATFPMPATYSTSGLASSLTANGGFNGAADTNLLAGADTLAVGSTATISFDVTFTPSGPFLNSALVSATSPGSAAVSDTSDDGSDPDPNGNGDPTEAGENDPTSIGFGENAVIGVAKQAGAVTDNGDGTFTTTISLVIENFGNVPLLNVQVNDNLAGTFTAPATFSNSVPISSLTANAAFDGSGNTNLLAGTDSLAVGATATISFDATFTPNTATGPFFNSAVASATSPGSAAVSDTSDDGTDPDPNGNNDPTEAGENDPTSIAFTEIPILGLAKQASTVIDNLDGTFTSTISMLLENLGNVPLASIQVTDSLAATFPAPVTFTTTGLVSSLTANAGFNGTGDINLLAGSDSLAVGATATLSFNVTFTPNTATGPFSNSSTGTAVSPAAAPVSDTSHNGADPDPNGNGDPTEAGENDPTPITFVENPVLGIAKQAGAATDNGDGTLTVLLSFVLENLGNVPLNNVQATDSLATTFAAPASYSAPTGLTSSLTANAGFNGDGDSNLLAGTDSLAVGASATISFSVTFTPNTATGPFMNQAVGTATSPAAAPVTDNSDDGTDPDPNGNGDPTEANENDPTPITFSENAVLGIAKSAGPVTDNGDGTQTVTLSFVLENLGNVPLANVQATDSLATTFAAPASFSVPTGLASSLTANGGFNGDGDTNLLAGTDSLAVGATATISFDVTFTPGTATGPFLNQAVAGATSPAAVPVTDNSTDGTDPDPNGNGDPTEAGENEPTSIGFSELPVVGVAKQAGTVIDNGDSTFTVPITVTVVNLGNVPLANLQVIDNLTTTFAAPAAFNAPITVSSTSLTPNPAYDGTTNANLLDGTDSLAVAETATITFSITFTPNGETGPFMNQASVSATSPAGATAGDTSDDGTDPDPNGNGDPNEAGENDPTPIAIAANIGDLVYSDQNDNGVHDPGEPGLAGVLVFLDANNNGVLDAGEATMSTDAMGNYDFTLEPGTYTVMVDESTLPPDSTHTSGNNPVTEILSLLENYDDADFGYRISDGVIGDRVWEDLNADGIQDVGEPGIENVTVQLDTAVRGLPGVQTTDEFGNYSFTTLPADDYTVTVTDTNNVLGGATLTGGTNPHNKKLVAGEVYEDADFGYCFPVVIVTGPQATDLCLGDELSLSVTAEGSALTYQWRKDGLDIPDETEPTFTINFVEEDDAAEYSVVVTNSCGTETSDNATVTVAILQVVIAPSVLRQGLAPLILSAEVSCPLEPANSVWRNVDTGEIVAVDTDTVTLPARLTGTTLFEFEITDDTGRTVTATVLALVPVPPQFIDFNNDGCNDFQDLLDFIIYWPLTNVINPNGDNVVDVRDFLYFNLDGCDP